MTKFSISISITLLVWFSNQYDRHIRVNIAIHKHRFVCVQWIFQSTYRDLNGRYIQEVFMYRLTVWYEQKRFGGHCLCLRRTIKNAFCGMYADMHLIDLCVWMHSHSVGQIEVTHQHNRTECNRILSIHSHCAFKKRSDRTWTHSGYWLEHKNESLQFA